MKRLSIMSAFAALALSSVAAMAETPTANFCTGGAKGNYYYAGMAIGRAAAGTLDVSVIETQGSIDNLKRMERGECDVAIVQEDALNIFKEDNPGSSLSIEPLTALYKEYAQLVCSKELGIDSITDLEKGNKVLVGPLGGGSYVTWRGFVAADKDYSAISTGPETGPRALLAIKGGTNAQCIMFVSGLNSAPIKELDRNSDGKLTLVEIDDGTLDNLKNEKGEKVYQFAKIPKTMYPNIGGGYAWDTVTVNAVVVVNSNWINANEQAFNTLAEAIVASNGDILTHVGQ